MNKKKYNVAILKNEMVSDHLVWVNICKSNERINSFDVIDLISNNWLIELKKRQYDLLLLKPSGIFEHLKRLYDERVLVITNTLFIPIYPSLTELLIYENKRFLRDWLMAVSLPHPETFVFYAKDKAIEFISNRSVFPIVAKTSIGASSNGVLILKNDSEAMKYVQEAFSTGIKLKTGPKITKGSLLKKIKKVFDQKSFLKQRINEYLNIYSTPQKNFVIFQEFIPHTYEWRCVRIGESYFAHKKIARNNISSGTLIKNYDEVPLALLDFIKRVTEQSNLSSVAIDLFEKDGAYLINEIQCIFGQSDPYQMLVHGKPGRYRSINNKWIFEEGMFNTNQSYDLRLEHAISMLDRE